MSQNKKSILGSRISTVYLPDSPEGFIYVKTEIGVYRLEITDYSEIDDISIVTESSKKVEFRKSDQVVSSLWSDSECLYIELSDGAVACFGFLGVTGEGKIYQTFTIVEKHERDDFYNFQNNLEMFKIE